MMEHAGTGVKDRDQGSGIWDLGSEKTAKYME
jgi:hypothetical protein